MKLAFEAKNVKKYFGDVKALDGVSLRAEQGTIFGLLGPNGAGKTTLVRMLSTLSNPDSGSIKVQGVNVSDEPDKVRTLIGLAGQFAAIDEYLTGRENLVMVGRLYRLSAKESKKRADEILKKLALDDAADRQARTYSGGMRRRLDLGASLVGKPKVLFLDEPTTGLDPRTRLDLWNIIRELVDSGTSILLTTQYLEEADELADKIAVIDRGKVIAEGTSTQLKAKLGGDLVEVEFKNHAVLAKAEEVVKKYASKQITTEERVIKIPVKDGSKGLLEIVRELDKKDIHPESISLHRPSLDDVFLTLTGKKATQKEQESKPKRGKK
ncbi:ATP-binding cassette domain-containing protein [Candidatus Saccharibacteria bacterium]|nr:ATP-binding cassette domain-containing protein [Candidatus Saccharibacteria bacterium]